MRLSAGVEQRSAAGDVVGVDFGRDIADFPRGDERAKLRFYDWIIQAHGEMKHLDLPGDGGRWKTAVRMLLEEMYVSCGRLD